MFRNILVATDGSDHATNAVRLAADIAKHYEARLLIANVISSWDVPQELRQMAEVEHLIDQPAPKLFPFGRSPFDQLSLEQRYPLVEAISQRLLERARGAAEAVGARNIETVSLEGAAADAIIDCAKTSGADLLVLGTRGLGRVEGLVLGSVSNKISRLAACPCLISR